MVIIQRCLAFALTKTTSRVLPVRQQSQRLAHTKRPNHLEMTAQTTRQDMTSDAVVTHIEDLSPTVKTLVLTVKEKGLTFKAGQWLDLHIPSVDVVGGFSISSSPQYMKSLHQLQLTVKLTRHPPAYWVHTRCEVGDSVKIRVGGDFFYDPKPEDSKNNLLLIAGGVGINPILSIMEHAVHLKELARNNLNIDCPQKVKMLFSAKASDELLFKNRIENICAENSDFSCNFHVTREETQDYSGKQIDRDSLEEAIKELSLSNDAGAPMCFLCGPAIMLDNMERLLLSLDIPPSHINYEKWW